MDVVFTYGRFNPPHLGHKMMIERIVNKARNLNKKPVIIVSHSVGNIRNPLPVDNKLRILRGWFPNVTFMSSAKNKSIAKISENFSSNSVMIVCENRKDPFKFSFLLSNIYYLSYYTLQIPIYLLHEALECLAENLYYF